MLAKDDCRGRQKEAKICSRTGMLANRDQSPTGGQNMPKRAWSAYSMYVRRDSVAGEQAREEAGWIMGWGTATWVA
jgi:hypothetical protein